MRILRKASSECPDVLVVDASRDVHRAVDASIFPATLPHDASSTPTSSAAWRGSLRCARECCDRKRAETLAQHLDKARLVLRHLTRHHQC